jgi:hypothetical protein
MKLQELNVSAQTKKRCVLLFFHSVKDEVARGVALHILLDTTIVFDFHLLEDL